MTHHTRSAIRSLSSHVPAAVLLSLTLAACGGGDAPDAGDNGKGGGAVGNVPVSETAPSTRALAPSPAPGGTPDPANTCGLPGFQADVLRQVNAARVAGRSCGATAYPAAAPLAWNAKLFSAAEGHSSDMAGNNYFSHTGLDGRGVSQRVTAAGYAWRAVGENIAAGQTDVTSAVNSWLGSEGHCRNIMNPAYQDVALACVQQAGTTYGRYWTMVLARP